MYTQAIVTMSPKGGCPICDVDCLTAVSAADAATERAGDATRRRCRERRRGDTGRTDSLQSANATGLRADGRRSAATAQQPPSPRAASERPPWCRRPPCRRVPTTLSGSAWRTTDARSALPVQPWSVRRREATPRRRPRRGAGDTRVAGAASSPPSTGSTSGCSSWPAAAWRSWTAFGRTGRARRASPRAERPAPSWGRACDAARGCSPWGAAAEAPGRRMRSRPRDADRPRRTTNSGCATASTFPPRRCRPVSAAAALLTTDTQPRPPPPPPTS